MPIMRNQFTKIITESMLSSARHSKQPKRCAYIGLQSDSGGSGETGCGYMGGSVKSGNKTTGEIMPTATSEEWDHLKTAYCMNAEIQKRLIERADQLSDKSNGEIMSGVMEEIVALKRQEGGDHYKKMKIQPIEYIIANNLDYLSANIIKYASRHKEKGGADDIRKIIHYCQFILESQYGVSE